jgi:hypothetical protein
LLLPCLALHAGAQEAPSSPPGAHPIFDPCAGPKELLDKLEPTPCVLITGQAIISGGYENINAKGTATIGGPQQRQFPISANANVYPLLFFAFGVSGRSQIQITPPSTVNLMTQHLGNATVTTDTALTYKQLLYYNPKSFVLAGVSVGYTDPTGDTSLGPAYQIEPGVSWPLNDNFSMGAYWTFENATESTESGRTQRAWNAPIAIYADWSPANAGFLLQLLSIHEFNPNRTELLVDASQLLNRHALVNVEYGGLSVSAAGTTPFAPKLTFTANAHPRIFSMTLYFLVGESNAIDTNTGN